ncbi:MAG: cadherin repeat domain-containing protein, partial [Rhodomicrobiaceae bacterium]
SIDYETATNHNIEVTATSEDGSTSTQTFAINVDNINESGVSAITDTDGSANNVDEDASVGAVVGITALATDADGTDTVTYSLSDDAGGLFSIDANTGVVTVASGLDAETATSHNIEVTATSTDGSTTTETFSIGVNDVNETSISAISDTDASANGVSESAAIGTAVGITALATDADVTDTVTYSLSSNPGGFFSIDANTGEVTVANALDFETAEDHTIEVTATSTDGTTSTQSFTIDVADDTSEASVSAISDTDASTNAVDENSAVGTSVGITAFASDADGSDDVTYSLSDDAGGLFTIDPNTGEVTVAGNIDYETATTQTIEVTATSHDGSTSTQ